MGRKRYFERGQNPTYKCRCCGITTRDTGDGEAGCELCVDCFELASLDNMLNDDGRQANEDERREAATRLARIAKKGGNVETVKSWNDFVWPTKGD